MTSMRGPRRRFVPVEPGARVRPHEAWRMPVPSCWRVPPWLPRFTDALYRIAEVSPLAWPAFLTDPAAQSLYEM